MGDANPKVSILVEPTLKPWNAYSGKTGEIVRTLEEGDPAWRADLHQVVVKLDGTGEEVVVPHIFLYF